MTPNEERQHFLITKSTFVRSDLKSPANNGYVSDYYKVKAEEDHPQINHHAFKQRLPKEKEFFQTKIDFAAPLKSILQV